ncbi:MAG: hypothetical protein WB501_06325 [Nitrososphaeraceae archaeon]
MKLNNGIIRHSTRSLELSQMGTRVTNYERRRTGGFKPSKPDMNISINFIKNKA